MISPGSDFSLDTTTFSLSPSQLLRGSYPAPAKTWPFKELPGPRPRWLQCTPCPAPLEEPQLCFTAVLCPHLEDSSLTSPGYK